MTNDKQVDYWKKGSDEDWESVRRMVESTQEYHWCLFVMHLSMEKALKGLVAKKIGDPPPEIHNLVRLADLADLELTEQQVLLLEQVNQFCLASRYPEEQLELRKLATREFALEYLERLETFRQWLMNIF